MPQIDGPLALRLIGVSLFVLLGPGLAFLQAVGVQAFSPVRVTLALAVSYSWIFALSVALPLTHGNIDHAVVLTVTLFAALLVIASRRSYAYRGMLRGVRIRRQHLLAGALLLALALLGWIIESPITGEEALDLVSAARFVDRGPVTLENTSLMPDTRPVYLFQPYQLALGMIARMSAVDVLITVVKVRAVLVPLGFILVYALLRQMTPTREAAVAAMAVASTFVALDFPTWEFNSLFPFVRRGAFTAGISVPALMTLVIVATRDVRGDVAARTRRVAIGVLPLFLLASMATHPLEMFTFLCFAAAVIGCVVLGFDRFGSRRHALIGALLLTMATAAYVSIQSRGVPQVAEYENADKADLRARLPQLATDPLTFVAGEIADGGRELWGQIIPSTITGAVGIPALAVIVWTAPSAAAWLTVALIPLAIAYLSPAGSTALALATSPATFLDVNAHFALAGLLALSIALATIARVLLAAAHEAQRGLARVMLTAALGSLVLVFAWRASRSTVAAVLSLPAAHPAIAAVVATLIGCGVLAVARRRRHSVPTAVPFEAGVIALAACLAVPVVLAGRTFQQGVLSPADRVSVVTRVERALEAPPVTDWVNYYPVLSTTIAPPLHVPRAVVDALKQLLPPREVLLSDPRDSCALVVLLDAYCINPEHIYGHYFLSARRYHDLYVRTDPQGPAWHPFFNQTWPVDDAEGRFLADYGARYILAGPEHAAVIDGKLRALGIGATAAMLDGGFVLYTVTKAKSG